MPNSAAELLTQLQTLNRDGKYEEVLSLMETIPEARFETAIEMEIARAYLSLVGDDSTDAEQSFSEIVEILSRGENEYRDNPDWHALVGMAHMNASNEEGLAVGHLQFAYEHYPEVGLFVTRERLAKLLERAEMILSVPATYRAPFAQRVKIAWTAFEANEAHFRELLARARSGAYEEAEPAINAMGEIFNQVLNGVEFELGFDGEREVITFTAQGVQPALFALAHFVNAMPKTLSNRWVVYATRQAHPEVGLRAGDVKVAAHDVQAWIEPVGEGLVRLYLYAEALNDRLASDPQFVWWFLTNLADQSLGELTTMSTLAGIQVIERPLAGREAEAIPLSEVGERLKTLIPSLTTLSVATVLNRPFHYERTPTPSDMWRSDIARGMTLSTPILNQYYQGNPQFVDMMHKNGIALGYLAWRVDDQSDEERRRLNEALKARLLAATTETGEASLVILGEASGLTYDYLDLMAWDLKPVLNHAKAFFEEEGIRESAFLAMRSGVKTFYLTGTPEGGATQA